MADAMVAADTREPARAGGQGAFSPGRDVLRDITRGGMSGAIVGIVVGGLGGRLVMRVIALLHPEAVGALTENGNRIGDVTLGGTLQLVLFGLVSCSLAGATWVIVGPWIPGRTRVRALLTAGIAIAIGTPVLVIGGNRDFVVLDHDPGVVVLLVTLVGLIGLSIALLDRWLDGKLPRAASGQRGSTALYATVALAGTVLVLPFVLLVFLTSDEYRLPLRAGYALLVVGCCTATWWGLRLRGRARPPRGLLVAARGSLLVAVILGVLTAAPHIARSIGRPS